mmetsp:Transcript_21543/g.21677  ORF Transcript_21543/g.21677 Transcript_21543/m.21677 type:complete len:98 (+) Transcript_21543:223-516(+)
MGKKSANLDSTRNTGSLKINLNEAYRKRIGQSEARQANLLMKRIDLSDVKKREEKLETSMNGCFAAIVGFVTVVILSFGGYLAIKASIDDSATAVGT